MSNNIIGIGTDLCSISRIEKCCDRESFLSHVCTTSEREWLGTRGKGKAQSLAALFAAKEASSKALGTGFSNGITMIQFELTHDELGAPHIALSGEALVRLHSIGANTMLLSLTHENDMAMAVAIAVQSE